MAKAKGKKTCPVCRGTGECRNPDGKVYDCSCVKKRVIGRSR